MAATRTRAIRAAAGSKDCTALTQIDISSRDITTGAFSGCTNMKYAVVDVNTWNELEKSGYAAELPVVPTINYIAGQVTEVPALNNHILAILNGGSIVDGEPTLSPADKVTCAQMAMLLTRFENTFEKTVAA